MAMRNNNRTYQASSHALFIDGIFKESGLIMSAPDTESMWSPYNQATRVADLMKTQSGKLRI